VYFKQFPKRIYGFDKKNFKPVTDLMIRVKVRDKVINELSLYNVYDVKNGETPENIAFKHFGDPELHWVILMTNNVTDRYYDWPLSEQQFEDYVKDKYSNPDGIHHYEITQSSGKTSTLDNSHLITVNSDASGANAVSNREHEDRINENKRLIKILKPIYLDEYVEEFKRLIQR
tara:strand:- start:7 stop:528 length:522 start_codon:yes stop_codon:yes gene_type:complete